MGGAVVLNIALNFILIPHYGLVGASFTTLSSEGVILCSGFFVIYRIGIRVSFGAILRPLLAAGIMGAGLIAFGPNMELAACIGLGFVIYIVTLVVQRGIPQDAQPHLRKLSLLASELYGKFRG